MTHADKPGAVFDCNIFFQATRNESGPAGTALRLLDQGAFSLFVSGAIVEEAKETFNDPRVRAKNARLTDTVVDALFDHLKTKATLVDEIPDTFTYERDPDDAKYINLALAVGAKYLVSRDKDLLDLMEDEAFRKNFPNLTILDPVAFLHELRNAESGESPSE